MSPRRNRRQPGAARTAARPAGAAETVQRWTDGDWVVRSLPGSANGKTYRCPGCDQEIPATTPHLVCWRADGGVADRRHWHRPCWQARAHRTPRPPRSR
ncbi:MAG: ATP/GTP-binding protein [Micromonosporaceae bacterium]